MPQQPGIVFPAVRPRTLWLLAGLAGLALVMSVLEASQLYLRARLEGWPIEPVALYGRAVASWSTFAVFTPLALAWARRWPLYSVTPATIGAHALGGLVFAIAHQVVTGLLMTTFLDHPLPTLLGFIAVAYTAIDILLYLTVVGLGHVIDSSRQLAAHNLQTAVLEADLKTAQLDAIKSRLHPHFLFNALNAVSGLALRGEGKAAAEATATLSEMLRDSLESREGALVAVAEEIRLAERYLDVWRLRFPDRFHFDHRVDEAVGHLTIPRLLLQPIIENAVLHGILPTDRAGVIRITATAVGDRIQLDIADNGVGWGPASIEGLGLESVRSRLARVYGPASALRVERNPGSGCRVVVLIPKTEGR